jgi:hypothetical protein
MNTEPSAAYGLPGPPAEYEEAMADIEERAVRGELSLAQAKQEIFALRARFNAEAGLVAQWATRAM